MIYSDEQLFKLEFLEKVIEAEVSLHEFLKQAWPYIEGDVEFIDSWHIQAICEHLEALSNREIKNLLINMPPRHSKSSLISVAFPAWRWIHKPSERFMFASYALSLSLRDSVKCRRVILSPWYQSRWGDRYKLVGDQNTKGRFDNSKSGYRIATSTAAAATGEGGSILVCFPYNTYIHTSIGKIKIGQIVEEKIDCQILSFNHLTNLLELDSITKYECNTSSKMIEIEFDDNTKLTCTADHPIFIENQGYIQAELIKVGDTVICLSS